jgi:hypothetical protein
VSDDPPALTVILTEFQTIRAAIDRKATSLLTLVSFNITAIAAVSGLVLSHKADIRLLLVLPVVSSGLGLLVFDLDRDIRLARSYIKNTLQPLAAQYARDDRVLRYASLIPRPPLIIIAVQAIPYGLLFPVVSLIALIVVIGHLTSLADWLAWGLGAVLLLVLLMVWSTRLWELRSEFKTHRRTARQSAASSGDHGTNMLLVRGLRRRILRDSNAPSE